MTMKSLGRPTSEVSSGKFIHKGSIQLGFFSSLLLAIWEDNKLPNQLTIAHRQNFLSTRLEVKLKAQTT